MTQRRGELQAIERQLARVFTPAAPISSAPFLRGRAQILKTIRRTWSRIGASLVLYGERGVGKTSLVKVAAELFDGRVFYHSMTARDSCSPATLVVAGIGDGPDDLIDGYESVQRHITALEVPGLAASDIRSILHGGARSLGIAFQDDAADWIVSLASHLPYSAHLLCEGAVHALLDRIRDGRKTELVVSLDEVKESIEYASLHGARHLSRDRLVSWFLARQKLIVR